MATNENVQTTVRLLTESDLAKRHQRSIKTIQADRLKGRGVPFLKIGKSVRYRLTDVEHWEARHLFYNTSQYSRTEAIFKDDASDA